MPAPVMGYHAKAVVEEKHHLRVPIVGRQRPTVTEHYGLARSPVLVEDLRSVFCRNRRHIESPCKLRLYLQDAPGHGSKQVFLSVRLLPSFGMFVPQLGAVHTT